MQRAVLISLMERPAFESNEQLAGVNSLAESYPWCSTFQVLAAVGSHQLDELDSKILLNRAAVYIGDRSKLYEYTVRQNLLGQIAAAEAHHNEQAEDTVKPNGALASQEEEVMEESLSDSSAHLPDEGPISQEPLEAQILIEAMAHVGELEVTNSLKDAEPGVKEEKQDEKQAENEEGLSDFSRWLRGLPGSTLGNSKVEKANTRKKQDHLIQRFIQESPHISPAKTGFFSPAHMGKMSLVEDETFVSETLARIYERQGDYKKAARAYANLKLKYPEKSSYFAALQQKAEKKP